MTSHEIQKYRELLESGEDISNYETEKFLDEIERLKQIIRNSMKFLVDHSGTVDYPRRLTFEELEMLYGFMKESLQ